MNVNNDLKDKDLKLYLEMHLKKKDIKVDLSFLFSKYDDVVVPSHLHGRTASYECIVYILHIFYILYIPQSTFWSRVIASYRGLVISWNISLILQQLPDGFVSFVAIG